MPEFKIADDQTKVLANLLAELTDRDVLKWKHVDTNCYTTRVGMQEFSFCQWHEGLEARFDYLCFRGYDYGLSELRDAVYEQRKRIKKKACDRTGTQEFDNFTKTGKASDEFRKHFGDCSHCQKVATEVAEIQGQNLKEALLQLHSQQ